MNQYPLYFNQKESVSKLLKNDFVSRCKLLRGYTVSCGPSNESNVNCRLSDARNSFMTEVPSLYVFALQINGIVSI